MNRSVQPVQLIVILLRFASHVEDQKRYRIAELDGYINSTQPITNSSSKERSLRFPLLGYCVDWLTTMRMLLCTTVKCDGYVEGSPYPLLFELMGDFLSIYKVRSTSL